VFGDIVDGEMRLNAYGQVVTRWWDSICVHFPNVETDEFVIMPNHIHGLININSNICRGEVSSPFSSSIQKGESTGKGGVTPPLQKTNLGRIIAYFKYQSAKQINHIRNTPGFPVWQRNYYEHIIRNEDELCRIREYVINNPSKWPEDENNPDYPHP
jgi:putative transposase